MGISAADVDDPNLKRMNALRLMIRDCLLPDGYSFPPSFGEAIVLSDVGSDWFERITAQNSDLSAADAKAALLAEFAIGDQLTFSRAATDFERARRAIHDDVKSRRILYPWVFSVDLDEAYLRTHGRKPQKFLGNAESVKLLDSLPQGVFQVADVTVGPLGMLVVPEQRCLEPTQCGPVIECMDPGCSGLHHAWLKPGETRSGKAYMAILPDIPLDVVLERRIADLSRPDDEYFRADNRWGLPWLLGNGLTDPERRELLAMLLKENRDGIREFAHAHLPDCTADRSARDIADAVHPGELFQLLLAATDGALVQTLETAIGNGRIVVGPTEIRRPFRSKHAEGGVFTSEAQASRLGVRFSPRVRVTGPVALKHLISVVYGEGSQPNLDWRLRAVEGHDTMARLQEFLRRTTPQDVVARLILDDRDVLLATFEQLRFGRFEVPRTAADEAELIERILWKLGYPLDAPASADAPVREYVAQMQQACRTLQPPGGARRNGHGTSVDEIRSVGINLFTALESLLDNALAFTCWALLGDPYPPEKRKRFVFRRSWARDFLRATMAESAGLPAGFRYNENGRNSLGVLVQSFRVLAAKCELALETPDAFRRPTESTPYFAAKSYSIYAFPFLHTRLILDLSEDSRRDLLAALRDVAAMLESGSVVDVRNRVVHAAEKFPGDAEIASACAMIERAVDILADRGLLPSVYAWAGDSMDSSRCRVTYMADGTGRTVELVSPSELDLCGLPQYSRPQLIMTAGRLKRTGEPVRFSYEEETGITEVWEDFLVRASEGKGIHDLAQPEPEASESHA